MATERPASLTVAGCPGSRSRSGKRGGRVMVQDRALPAVADPRESSDALRPTRALPLGPALRARQAAELSRRLAPLVKGHLQLAITDNRAVMISIQRDPRQRAYRVRLHRLFVDAPATIVRSLALYITLNDRPASAELNRFIDDQQERLAAARRRSRAPERRHTRGRVHDLQAVFDDLNASYFAGGVRCAITWGRHGAQGRTRRSIKVGSYCFEERLIRIHPGLDQDWVPAFYIRWVVFHEMLHALHPVPQIAGRRVFHSPAFAADEKSFAEHREATEWERRHLAALLCA